MATVELSSIEDLDNISNALDGDYLLITDLDFNDDASYDDSNNKSDYTTGTGWDPIDDFNGSFSGQNYHIDNLFCNEANYVDYVAFFGDNDTDATICDVHLGGVFISGGSYVAGLIAEVGDDDTGIAIRNCSVSGEIYGESNVGFIIGKNGFNDSSEGYDLQNCHASGFIKFEGNDVGGLIGELYNSSISGCTYKGRIITDNTGIYDNIGGIVGYFDSNTDDTIISCNVNCTMISGADDNTGGLVGYLYKVGASGCISNCWVSTQGLYGEGYMGGAIGRNGLNNSIQGLDINRCYISTNIYSTEGNLGGVVGMSYNSDISSCTFKGEIKLTSSVYDYVGGIVGFYEGETYDSITTCGVNSHSISGAGENTGGLVGYLYNAGASGQIYNCWVSAQTIYGEYYVGGLVGRNGLNNSSSPGIDINYSRVSSNQVKASYNYVGGIVGIMYISNISTSRFIGNTCGDTYVGGVAGYLYDSCEIYNSYAIGTAEADDKLGGFVGENYRSKIDKCYCAMTLYSGTNTGGFCGVKDDLGNYLDSSNFWDKTLDGDSSEMGSGATTTQLQSISTFSNEGWDIVTQSNWTNEPWFINDGEDYPRLGFEWVLGVTYLHYKVPIGNSLSWDWTISGEVGTSSGMTSENNNGLNWTWSTLSSDKYVPSGDALSWKWNKIE